MLENIPYIVIIYIIFLTEYQKLHKHFAAPFV